MSQISEFLLPDTGERLTEAEIVRWLVDVGDRVRADQPVVEVETAKATVELPRPYRGTVASRVGDVGDLLPVASVLVTVAVGATEPLGVGRIVAKPWVHDGELAVRKVVQFTLTFDQHHRFDPYSQGNIPAGAAHSHRRGRAAGRTRPGGRYHQQLPRPVRRRR